mgnify:CR=1 FL=1
MAVKRPSGDGVASSTERHSALAETLSSVNPDLPQTFCLGYSCDWVAGYGMAVGGDAWFSVLGGLFPQPCLDIIAAARAGAIDRVEAIIQKLKPLFDIMRRHGSLRVAYCTVNLCQWLDHTVELPRPLLALELEEQAKVRAALIDSGLAEAAALKEVVP